MRIAEYIQSEALEKLGKVVCTRVKRNGDIYRKRRCRQRAEYRVGYSARRVADSEIDYGNFAYCIQGLLNYRIGIGYTRCAVYLIELGRHRKSQCRAKHEIVDYGSRFALLEDKIYLGLCVAVEDVYICIQRIDRIHIDAYILKKRRQYRIQYIARHIKSDNGVVQ